MMIFVIKALLVPVIIQLCVIVPIKAQYEAYGGSGGYGSGGDGYVGHDESEMDERPRVQLGLRLRIPAFKFELPRMTLPKITINARIRQPDQPRVIRLPEINLDTSSRLSAPGFGALEGKSGISNGNYMSHGTGKHGGYGAAAASQQNVYSQKPMSSYDGAQSERTQSFSFSAQEDKRNQAQNVAQMRTYYNQPSASYRVRHHQVPNQASLAHVQTYQHSEANINQDQQLEKDNLDAGFNAPVYVDTNSMRRAYNSYYIEPSSIQADQKYWNHLRKL